MEGVPGGGDDNEAMLGVCFAHPSWLGGPLGLHNVIDFFSASDFYDKSCNNELLRMQERDSSMLKNMTGLEYEIRYADEPQGIFVICKQVRESPELVHPQAYYYIMHGTVYQCPTIQHVLTARMMTCSYHLEEAFSMLRAAVRFDPSHEPNYTYDFTSSATEGQTEANNDLVDDEEEVVPQEKTHEEIYRIQQTAERSSRILSSIVEQFPLPGDIRPPTNTKPVGRTPHPSKKHDELAQFELIMNNAVSGRHGATKARAGPTQDTKKRRLADL